MKKIITLITIISLLFSVCNFSFVSLAANETVISYSFEDDSEDWIYWSSTAEKCTYPVTDAYSKGERALFLCDASNSSATGIQSAEFSVTPGETYTLLTSFYVIKYRIRAYLRFYDSAGNRLSSDSITATIQNSWEQIAITATAPSDSATGRIIICTDSTDIAGGYIDDVNVVVGEAEAMGTFSATVPGELPEITQQEEIIDIIDDGYENGQIIYSESFEDGENSIKNWTPYVSEDDYDVVNKNATDGNYSLYVKGYGAPVAAGVFSETFKVAQGNTYTIYADIYNYAKGIALYIRFYDEGGVNHLTQTATTFNSKGWLNGRLQATAPVGAVSAKILIVGNTAEFGEAYYDNIRVYKGNIIIRHGEYEYSAPEQPAMVDSQIIAPVNGKLVYNSYNDKGDTLSDFSYAGFYAGEVDLPDTDKLPVSAVLSPSGTGDDTSMIQAAIDNANSEFSGQGMKVVKLQKGTYYINQTGLKLKSGVVLLGEGQGPTGTVLYAKDAVSYNVIEAVIGTSVADRTTSKVLITDDYIEAGSKEINVEDASEFKVGDTIRIVHPSTDSWIDAMKMKDITTVYGSVVSWTEGALDNKTERIITAIEGNKISLDYGFFIPYEKEYAESYVYGVDDTGYLKDIGVENLRIQSYFNGDPYDLEHAKMAIYVKRARNLFVRNVTAKNMYNGVFGCRVASQITVQNCSNLDPVSTVAGGNRYPFYADVDCEKILFNGCYSYDGRHDYMAVKGTAGPVVFSDSIADMSNAASETHAGFATGVLYDNIYQINDKSNGYFALSNRGYYGTDTPQGWTAAGSVMWNCLANSIIVNKPPLNYQNFSIGVWGIYNTPTSDEVKESQRTGYRDYAYRTTDVLSGTDVEFATKDGTSFIGDAYKEAEFNSVNPRSLYKAQLSERFTGVITNAKPNAPVIVYPRPDKEFSSDENNVVISGVYELGAERVSVYIDNTKYTAVLNSGTNEFSLSVSLEDGVHKIYATQTIDGVEGNKTADRFITVGESDGSNPSYLQSDYDKSITTLILNDTRKTYDEEIYGVKITNVDYRYSDNSWYITFTPSICENVGKYIISMDNADDTVITEFNENNTYKLTDTSGTLSEVFVSVYDEKGNLFETSYAYEIDFVYSDGSGTYEDPYVISTVKQFTSVFGLGTTNELDKVYLLTGFDKTPLSLPEDFKPAKTIFTGQLIGGNKTDGVINYDVKQKINISSSLSSTDYIKTGNLYCAGGLFHILSGATVKNLEICGSITSQSISGISYFGTLAGRLSDSSVVSNVDNYADVKSYQSHGTGGIIGVSGSGINSIINCNNYGDIICSDNYAGGIIGDKFRTTLENSFNYGKIEGKNYVGGLVALNKDNTYDVINNCANFGDVTATEGLAGGIAGSSRKNIINCYNMGNIAGLTYAGSIVGEIASGRTSNIINCYNTGIISGPGESGIVIGANSGASSIKGFYDLANPDILSVSGSNSGTLTVSDVYGYGEAATDTTYDVKKVTYSDIMSLTTTSDVFKDDSLWKIASGLYPVLASNTHNHAFAGLGTKEHPYYIFNVNELKMIEDYPTCSYKQIFDIDNMTDILCLDTVFSGNFDGNGKTIEICIDDTENSAQPKYAGLFGKISGAVSNLTITGSLDAGWANYQSGIGAFAGYALEGATVTNCKNYASVTSTGHQTAGIIGRTSGNIVITYCHNYGDITAGEKASGIVGLLNQKGTGESVTYPEISNCGNYGNVTGGTIASGISSWVYSKQMFNNFNVGTIKATKSSGVATGLFGQLENNGTVIKNSYNAGTLIGNVTYGICYMNFSKPENTYTVQNCYNAVYATHPVTANCVPTVKNCYYLAGSENGEYGIYKTKVGLKGIFNTIPAFDICGDYKYPQLINNPLDEDRDNFDFYTLKFTDNSDNLFVDSFVRFDTEMCVKEGTVISLSVLSESDFHSITVSKNEEDIYNGIADLTNVEINVNEDTVVDFSEEVITPDIPENMSASTWLYNSLKENESVEVDGVTYEKCVIIASKATKLSGLKLLSFGAFMGEDEENLNYKIKADNSKISSDGSYGILIYSRTDDKNGLKDNTTYHIMPYATYVDISGNEYTLTGNKENFMFEENQE